MLVRMNRVRMLPEVVETRKGAVAVASEWPLAGMFADVAGEVL